MRREGQSLKSEIEERENLSVEFSRIRVGFSRTWGRITKSAKDVIPRGREFDICLTQNLMNKQDAELFAVLCMNFLPFVLLIPP